MAEESVRAVVAAQWCELLGVAEVADDDNFFLKGGNSIVALALVAKVESRLGIEFPLRVLFIDGTFGALVSACRQAVPG